MPAEDDYTVQDILRDHISRMPDSNADAARLAAERIQEQGADLEAMSRELNSLKGDLAKIKMGFGPQSAESEFIRKQTIVTETF